MLRRACAVVLVLFVVASGAARAHASDGGVVERQVVFDVRNTNRSGVPCTSDSSRYQVHGTLVAPASMPTAGSVTVYLHGFNVAGWMWNFKAVDGYDYAAAMAERGHVSLVLDRLGYLSSGQPDGMQTCLGSEADILHQLIQRLRAGTYQSERGPPKKFGTIVTAGQDIGGAIIEIEAYSYKDVDGLALLGWADQGFTPNAFRWTGEVVPICAEGGQPAEQGGPGGYARFIQSDQEIRDNAFPYAEPAVVEAIFHDIRKNPCGDFQSITTAVNMDLVRLHEVVVPVLVLYPDHDLVITPEGYSLQRFDFAPNTDVTTIGIQGGHFPMLETSPSRVFQQEVAEWLTTKHLS